MLLQFRLSVPQILSISERYPTYGGDARDSIEAWIREHVTQGCYVYYDYDRESDYPYIVDIDTRGKKIELETLDLSDVSQFKEIKENK